MSEITVNQNNSLEEKLSTEPTVDSNLNSTEIKDNGEEVADSSPNKRIKLSNDVNVDLISPPPQAKGRPSKAKRLNILEKTAKEGEVLLQNLGHKSDDDPEGTRRRTRSQTRGTPPTPTPTPPKKAAPKTPQKDNSSPGTPKRRGRPPKNSVLNNSVEDKTDSNADSESKGAEDTETTEALSESQEKTVNNTSETNNNNTNDANSSEQTNSAGAEPAADKSEAPAKETAEAPVEQTNALKANELTVKANSLSADTSAPVPVIGTQPPVPKTN